MSDPFEALGLPATFALDRATVERAYLARAAAAHPDHAGGGGSGSGQDEGERLAAALNAARTTLLDPERRAAALVLRFGGGRGQGGAADRALPSGFLEAMMEAREQMDADRAAAGDAGAKAAVAARWGVWAEARRRGHIDAVGRLFAEIEAGVKSSVPATSAGLAAIRREMNAWRYIERMIEQIEGAEDGHDAAGGAATGERGRVS